MYKSLLVVMFAVVFAGCSAGDSYTPTADPSEDDDPLPVAECEFKDMTLCDGGVFDAGASETGEQGQIPLDPKDASND
jgi:hypothetical protein